jgi:hypothetical protein
VEPKLEYHYLWASDGALLADLWRKPSLTVRAIDTDLIAMAGIHLKSMPAVN